KNFYGVIPFVDPQKLNNFNYKCDKKSDVYSIGVLMWEISSDGQIPFPQANYAIIAARTPMDYINLYSKCWNNEPDERPSMEEIFQQLENLELHVYFLTALDQNFEAEVMDTNISRPPFPPQSLNIREIINDEAWKKEPHKIKNVYRKLADFINENVRKEIPYYFVGTREEINNESQSNLDYIF
ncbi:12408_t:CDS:2, partial [Racocetra fulgida]